MRKDTFSPYEQFMEYNSKESYNQLPQNLSHQSIPYYPYPEISNQFPEYQMAPSSYQYQPAYPQFSIISFSNQEYNPQAQAQIQGHGQPNPNNPHSKHNQMNFYMSSSNINIGSGGNYQNNPQYMPYEYGNYYYPPYNQPMVCQEFYPNKVDLKC